MPQHTTPAELPARPQPAKVAPTPPEPAVPRWRPRTFRALRHRNYRLYFFGQLVSLTGTWVQTAAVTWLAYDLTGQSFWAGLIFAAQVLPTSLLGTFGGSLADRWPKRALLLTTQSILLLLAVVLAVIVLTGRVSPWHLLAVSCVTGLVNAVDFPARLSFVVDMVGRDDLINAVALNSLMFNVARVIGPAIGSLALPLLGAGHCFLFNGLSYVAVLAALWCMDVRGAPPAADRNEKPSLLAGFHFLAHRPGLILLLLLTGAMSLFAWPILSLLPALADKTLHVREGGSGYGALLCSFGVGALLASLLVASFGSLTRRRLFLGLGMGLSAPALVCLSLVENLPQAAALCILLGAGLILFNATSQSVTQLSATDGNRGRVMGVWSMVVSGAMPLGNLVAGLSADRWGVPLVLTAQALGIAGAAALVLGLVVGLSRRSA
jgi:MFS family permease